MQDVLNTRWFRVDWDVGDPHIDREVRMCCPPEVETISYFL